LAGRRLLPLLNSRCSSNLFFPNDKLSIQVHPDDAYAAKHEQAAGPRKTEMWHLVWARAARKFLSAETRREQAGFLRSLSDNSVENLLSHIPVKPAIRISSTAGTQHAMAPAW